MVKTKPFSLLSGNTLKLLAVLLMIIDHVGMIFFWTVPGWQYEVLRSIGRPCMPIFAYFIAEGCRYTRSPWGYLGKLFACLGVCQVGYYIGMGSLNICIFGTLLIGATLLLCLQNAKKALFAGDLEKGVLWALLFLTGIFITYYVNQLVYIDYGFWGCLLPVFAGAFFLPETAPAGLKKLDNKWTGLMCFAIGLCLLSWFDDYREVQVYCLFALPLLALYSGKRGKWKLKYFFYLFYPIHLVALEGIYLLMSLQG